jgi:peptidoglycan/LPS O-acetylase OafA/YrhL
VAVASVVLYHADSHWLPGGFTGVDVFFVISGYLITRLIAEDVANDRFTLARFYERRARRILPALFVVMLAASIAALFWLPPNDLVRFGQSLVATGFFVSNFFFWRQTGYFDAPVDAAPLLHTWSLAVEEQFYLLFPLVLVFLLRRAPRHLPAAIWGMLAASLALAEWGVRHHPGPAFYLGPTRAWELLCGAVLALRLVPPVRGRVLGETLALTGLALIAAGFLLLSADSRFPGVNALLPCLGAALLIHAGESRTTWVGRLLSLRAVVFVGLISYSLYLWHWVFFVYARHLAMRMLTPGELALLIGVSVVAAVLSWRFVEQPLRRASRPVSRPSSPRPVLVTAAAGSAAFVALGAVFVAVQGLPQRLPPLAREFAAAEDSIWPKREECDGRLCEVGAAATGRPAVLLWGDSHAASLAPAIAKKAGERGARAVVAFKRSCAPLVNFRDYAWVGSDCYGFTEEVFAFVERERVPRVVLHARWAWYVEGSRNEQERAPHIQMAANEPGPKANLREFSRLLRETVLRLQALGVEVAVVTSVPEVGFSAPELLTRRALRGEPTPFVEQETFERRQARAHAAIESMARETAVDVLHVYPWLCREGRCAIAQGSRALYHDDDHLSLDGARVVRQALAPVFETPLPR